MPNINVQPIAPADAGRENIINFDNFSIDGLKINFVFSWDISKKNIDIRPDIENVTKTRNRSNLFK